jgi:hypothetical protein
MIMSTTRLLETLDDIRQRIEKHDSLQGTIAWEATDTVDMWDVHGVYRVGNQDGQGGVRVINREGRDDAR